MKGTVVLGIDIETTGLSKDNDYVIELGVLELREGVVTNQVDRIFGGGKSGQKALETHKITDEERACKESFAKKASLFKSIVTGVRKDTSGTPLKTIIVGHNVKKFDVPFLFAACKRSGCQIEPDGLYVLDTCNLAKKYLSAVDYRLETLCKTYNFEHGGHRALGDVKSCLNILSVILEKSGVSNVIELAEPLTVQ